MPWRKSLLHVTVWKKNSWWHFFPFEFELSENQQRARFIIPQYPHISADWLSLTPCVPQSNKLKQKFEVWEVPKTVTRHISERQDWPPPHTHVCQLTESPMYGVGCPLFPPAPLSRMFKNMKRQLSWIPRRGSIGISTYHDSPDQEYCNIKPKSVEHHIYDICI